MAVFLKRVLIVTNIPNPYRIPFFNELNRRFKELNIHLKIAFGAKSYSRRKFRLDISELKFDYVFLPSKTFHFGNNEKTFFTYNGLIKLVKNFQPDKIITNGFSIGTVKLWWRSLFKKTHFIIWSESIFKKGRNDSLLRKFQRKQLLKRAAGFIVSGSKAKNYLATLGAPDEKISIAINTVDTEFFFNETKRLRAQFPPDDKNHLSYIGYLVERKNVRKLLNIVKILFEIRQDFIFDIIGDGDQKAELEMYVRENGLHEYVIFHGFKQKKEIPLYLSKSNVFLFQTDFDVWGMVLNEAMAAGIPCLGSLNAGASFDLIKEGVTGFVIDFNDHNKVAQKIDWLLNHPEESKRIGEKAAIFIKEEASISKSVEGFLQAVLNY